MSRVIIFGASGFVGQSLVALLQSRGVEHVGLSSKALDLVAPDAAAKVAATVQDGDRVVMLSAYTPERGDAGETTVKNIQMMHHLLAGLKGKQLAHFIYVSSDAVYPMGADIIDEHTPPRPERLYGHAHFTREQFAIEHFAPERLTILRPCAIYGQQDTHNAYGISRFIRSALDQSEIVLFGGGEEYRDHLHIDDFTAIIFDALERRVTGLYNVASGTSWRFIDIAQQIQSCFGQKIALTHKPRAIPITHRHMQISALNIAFPANRTRSIGDGIAQECAISLNNNKKFSA